MDLFGSLQVAMVMGRAFANLLKATNVAMEPRHRGDCLCLANMEEDISGPFLSIHPLCCCEDGGKQSEGREEGT